MKFRSELNTATPNVYVPPSINPIPHAARKNLRAKSDVGEPLLYLMWKSAMYLSRDGTPGVISGCRDEEAGWTPLLQKS